MASKPETRFYNSVHRYVPKQVYSMKNNNPFISGIADVWYSFDRTLWVEYKYLDTMPVKRDTNIEEAVSSLQADWLEGRHKQGRQVAVIVGCPKGGVIFPGLDWKCTLSADEFLSRVVSREAVAAWIFKQVSGDGPH